MRSYSKAQYIRQAEVARMLGVSDATVMRWRLSGNLPPAVRLSDNTIVWKLAEIELWLESKREDRRVDSRVLRPRW